MNNNNMLNFLNIIIIILLYAQSTKDLKLENRSQPSQTW